MLNLKELEYMENKNGCFIVTSHTKNSRGYPQFARKGKKILIHRYMYEKHYGKIPDGFNVCHKCDTPSCCNPEHLFLGTQKDNIQDAIKKGRIHSGEKINSSKLTISDVIVIRGLENLTQRQMANIYSVTIRTIRSIRNRETWRHIPC